MRPDTVGSYHDAAGMPHQVLVRETRGGWQVLDLDTAAGQARAIDTLDGRDDGRPQAEAIAADYLTTVERSPGRAGRSEGEAISEQGGPDDRSHPDTSTPRRKRPARRVALPDPAR
jgi:hypothetical protein